MYGREELEYHIISDEDLYEEEVYLKNQADKVMDAMEARIKELEEENKHLDDMVDAYQKSEALDIAKMDKKDERIKELEEQCNAYQAELMNNDPALNPATEESSATEKEK